MYYGILDGRTSIVHGSDFSMLPKVIQINVITTTYVYGWSQQSGNFIVEWVSHVEGGLDGSTCKAENSFT